VSYFVCFSSFFDLQRDILLTAPASAGHFVAHGLSMVLIGLLFYQAIGICREHLEGKGLANMTWILCLSIVFFLSCDLCLAANMIFYSKINPLEEIEQVYIKTALPVLWGLCSFAMMWLGMRHKDRTLRIVSLSLFSATLIKLFLFDIRNIPAAGKIVAFFCLGILLLIVSFMYQKVKKIIIADEEQSS
jgi:hypothetical protein